jgi:serine/threonine-protein kinase RsbW
MQTNLKIKSNQASLRLVENAIDDATLELGITQDSYGKILVSALEAVNNAILHGNKLDQEKWVEFKIEFINSKLKIFVSDEGSGFKPDEVPDPTLPQNIESCNGRGVYLMKHLADEIEYSEKGNSVIMTFYNILT